MDLQFLAWELGTLIVTVSLVSVIVLFTLGQMLKKKGPELAKTLLKSEEMRVLQQMGAESKVTKTASQMVAKDIMETTPLSELVKYLSEDTRLYLQAHPEALPGILQNYAGTVDLALTLAPRIQEVLGLAKSEKQSFDL